MKTVEATPERVQQLGVLTDDGPVVMINLLRYREQASYSDDHAADFDATPCSGREAYARYVAIAASLVGKAGGRPLWMGKILSSLIAPDGEAWDDAVLVEYPSRQNFIELVTSEAYLAAAPHRTAALDDSRLMAASAQANLFPTAVD